MMSYGWAILIIVIVAAVLYSFGVLSPSNSASTTVTGFSGLGSVQAQCFPGGGLVLQLGNSLGTAIKITKLNTTSQSGTKLSENFSTTIPADGSINFVVAGACSNASSSSYSNQIVVTYTEPGQPFPGPYFSSGTVSGKASAQGSSASFNGVSSIIIAPSVPFIENNYTFIAWANYPVSNLGDLIITSDANGGAYSWMRNQNSTSYGFSDYLYAPLGPLNNWDLVVVTVSTPGNTIFYTNGALSRQTASGGSRGTSAEVDIGAWQCSHPGDTSPCQFYTGKLADIQIYTKTLTLQQVQTLYAEGLGGAPLSNTNLLGWWPLDGNANDYSGDGNNGVAYSVQWVSP